MPAYESELLAIVHALLKWKSFIDTKPVVVETDHATLSRILQQKQVTSRLGYLLDKLADFDINIVYKPGKQNVVVDAISRRQDFVGVLQTSQATIQTGAIGDLKQWETEYDKCLDFQRPYRALTSHNSVARHVLCNQREFSLENGYLWVRTKAGWKVCVPSGAFRRILLEQYHD
ncbi:transposon ty3-g gag-pol polyprotein, partial [Cystoisospora suis]